MKKFWKIVAYISLGLSSFVLFLFITFPYEVLKQTIIIEASEQSDLSLKIGSLGPSFPLGLRAEEVQIGDNHKAIKFQSLSANLGFLSLLIGNGKVSISIEDPQSGYLDFEVHISIFEIMKNHFIPNIIYLEANNFEFGKIINLLLHNHAKGLSGNEILIKPLLENINVKGSLNADIDLTINSEDYKSSIGNLNLSLGGLEIHFLESDYPIPDQIFSQATIESQLKNGIFKVSDKSKLKSQDLDVNISGLITQKPQLQKSKVDFNLNISIGEEIINKNTFLLDLLDSYTQRQTNGKIKVKIFGPLYPMPSVTLL